MLVRTYETIFITKPDFEQESVTKLHERLLKAIDSEGGVELKLVDWGRRRLAYPIARNRKGNYFYFGYIASPKCLSEVHRHLGLSGDVVRYQTIALSKLNPLVRFDVESERKRVDALTPDPQDEQEEDRRRERRDHRHHGGDSRRHRAPYGDADKAPADKASADKAPADKASADKAPAAKASADKAPADKASADKASADKAPAEKTKKTKKTQTKKEVAAAKDDKPATEEQA